MKQCNSTKENTIWFIYKTVKGAEDSNYTLSNTKSIATIQFSHMAVMDDFRFHWLETVPCYTLHSMSEKIGCSKIDLIQLLIRYARWRK